GVMVIIPTARTTKKAREYEYPASAVKFLDRWCTRTVLSKIEPMKKVAKMLRNHRELLLNWFQAKAAISSGVVLFLEIESVAQKGAP
ncbi:MAG: transposase, partial [Oligoflexus sp.]|nr:transposase [Oligoflexus sp.]